MGSDDTPPSTKPSSGAPSGGDLLDVSTTSTQSSGSKNIKIPFAEVLNPSTASVEKKLTGLKIEGAFQREGGQVFLELKFTNQMQGALGVL